jgi:hypothetical protein
MKLETIQISLLANVAGGVMPGMPRGGQAAARIGAAIGSGNFDYNRNIDNANRYGNAGVITGAAGGAVIGGAVGGPAGAGLGAGLGAAGLGAAGFVGGAIYDANQQANEMGGRR